MSTQTEPQTDPVKRTRKRRTKGLGRGWHGNPEGHSQAGRAGGVAVSANREHMAEIGRRGGSKTSQNKEFMAAIGRIGGKRSGAGVKDLDIV